MPAETSTGALGRALVEFSACSIAMVLGNKFAVHVLPLPCTLVLIQAVATIALLYIPAYSRKELDTFSLRTTRDWFPVAFLFTSMIFTSINAFAHSGVTPIMIFRNVSTIITTIVEYFVRPESVTLTWKIIAAEVLIVVGAAVYGHASTDYTWEGLSWITANMVSQVAYFTIVRKKMDGSFKGLSKFSMSRYNHVVCIPLLVAMLVGRGEHTAAIKSVEQVSTAGWFAIAFTCYFGFLLSTSGFGLQKLVSAGTFLVVNNLIKFVNILAGIIFLGDSVSDRYSVAGCVLALGAGAWYSYEQSQLNQIPTKEEASGAAKTGKKKVGSKEPLTPTKAKSNLRVETAASSSDDENEGARPSAKKPAGKKAPETPTQASTKLKKRY